MKIKFHKNIINTPSHVERVWNLCYDRFKIIEFIVETSPRGYCNSLLIQFGGDAWFYKSLSLGNVLIAFSLVPYRA